MSKAAELAKFIGDGTRSTHPAFLARPSSAQNGIAVGATTTLNFGTEVFDQNGDYNHSTSTFTAPVTGKYYLQVQVRMDDIDIDVDLYELQIVTSNRTYLHVIDPDLGDQNYGYYGMQVNVVADMDASDTAKVIVYQNNGTQQTAVIDNSYFSGYLVC